MERQLVDGQFNKAANLPYELRLKDFEMAMQDVYDFFYDVNVLLLQKGLHRMDGKQRGKVTQLWGEQRRKGTHPV